MAPSAAVAQASPAYVGPSSVIKVSTLYYFQQEINIKLVASGSDPQREDQYRLQGVSLLHEARLALRLPHQTFAVAAFYYHRFRLDHKDNQYQWQDAAMAALLAGCKIEDTLKKSKEIICAVHNLKNTEQLSPDDPRFDKLAQTIVGLERLMLESSKFDFRTRSPPLKHMIKIIKHIGLGKDVTASATDILNDSYKTWAPMKQTTSTLVFACIELALRIAGASVENVCSPNIDYQKFGTKRAYVMETLLDLTDLYTHFHKYTLIGQRTNMNDFIQLRIMYNKEMDENSFDRFCHTIDPAIAQAKCTPKTPLTPASPAEAVRQNGNTNGANTASPRSSGSRSTSLRPADSTIRFMLDRDQAREEQLITESFHTVEYEEYEAEVEEIIPPARPANRHPPNSTGYRGRGDYGGYYKRGGRR